MISLSEGQSMNSIQRAVDEASRGLAASRDVFQPQCVLFTFSCEMFAFSELGQSASIDNLPSHQFQEGLFTAGKVIVNRSVNNVSSSGALSLYSIGSSETRLKPSWPQPETLNPKLGCY